jgi:hypothetical protein
MTDPTLAPAADDQADATFINEFLDVDDVLAAPAHLSEKTEILYTKPELEAEINALELELQGLTDGTGAPVLDADGEASVGDAAPQGGRTARVVALEIQAKRREYAESGRKIVLRQLPSEDWLAFEATWKKALDAGAPYPPAMWDDLIAKSAIRPEMTAAKVKALRTKFGNPTLYVLGMTCWKLNTESGISIPFSQLSSAVLKPRRHATS